MLYLAFVAAFLLLWAIVTFALPGIWHGLGRVANRAAASSMRFGIVKRFVGVASPFRDYLPVVLIVVAGALLAAAAGDEFLDLAELVHSKSTTLQAVDSSVHDWAVSRRYDRATTFFALMSVVGGPVGLGVLLAAALAALALRKHYHRIAYLLLTAVGGGLLDLELKRYFGRARPALAEMLRTAHGYSFPSGHAMGSTVVFGALAYVAFRGLPQWRWKSAAIALAITLVLAVALSRVYLGVHWISDVSAGVGAGLLWLTTTTVGYETFRRIHLIRQLRAKNAAPISGGPGAA